MMEIFWTPSLIKLFLRKLTRHMAKRFKCLFVILEIFNKTMAMTTGWTTKNLTPQKGFKGLLSRIIQIIFDKLSNDCIDVCIHMQVVWKSVRQKAFFTCFVSFIYLCPWHTLFGKIIHYMSLRECFVKFSQLNCNSKLKSRIVCSCFLYLLRFENCRTLELTEIAILDAYDARMCSATQESVYMAYRVIWCLMFFFFFVLFFSL